MPSMPDEDRIALRLVSSPAGKKATGRKSMPDSFDA
jgi:hypothetical protein